MSNQLEIRHIQYFLAVAEDLHFRKAAERLYISQPGLSRQIKQMEEILSVTLFDRHNRKVMLTPTGQYLQQEFTILLKKMEITIDHAQLVSRGLEGSLKIGYIGSAMQEVIPTFLLAFQKDYPNIHFDLTEMDNQRQVESLLDQDIDLGFVRMDHVPSGLQIHSMFEETFSLVLPENHPINSSNFKDLSQVCEESFILFDPNYSKSYYNKVMKIFEESNFTPKISHNSVQANTIYRLIENNFGVAIVPTSLQNGYDMRIKFIELNNIRHRTTLRAVWNQNNQNPILSNATKLLIQS